MFTFQISIGISADIKTSQMKLNLNCLSFCLSAPLSYGPLHHPVAVPAPPAGGPAAASPDFLDGRGWRVQAARRRGGRTTVGAPQEQTQHELRQAEPSTAVLLRQGTTDNTVVTQEHNMNYNKLSQAKTTTAADTT